MSMTKIKQRLREAERLWSTGHRSPDIEGLKGFIPGVLQGLREALRIVEACHRDEIQKIRLMRRPLSRWNAQRLQKACQQAYARLIHSDRKGALKTLQRALDTVSPDQKG